MSLQTLQSEASRLPVDPTLFRTVEKRLDHALSRASRESRREKEEWEVEHNTTVRASADEGFVKREAIKQEGKETEEHLSRRQAERAARRGLSGFDPSDVLKGVREHPVLSFVDVFETIAAVTNVCFYCIFIAVTSRSTRQSLDHSRSHALVEPRSHAQATQSPITAVFVCTGIIVEGRE